MCAVINGDTEHCAVTVGKPEGASVCYLEVGGDTSACSNLAKDSQLNYELFSIGRKLQDQVLLCLPSIPAMFLLLGFLALGIHGLADKPFVGFASSARQYRRNRHLDILRYVVFGLLTLATLFSFAIAVGASQMYAGLQIGNPGASGDSGAGGTYFTVNRGTSALAIHWTAVMMIIIFFIGVNFAITKLSMVSFAVAPPDAAGTGATAFDMSNMQGPLEKASLLRSATPMGMEPPPNGVTAEATPPTSMGAASMSTMGARGGMAGRGGPMGARGRGAPMRGGAMARGGMASRGGMATRGRGVPPR